MKTVCTQCHAELAQETQADWCPACGGALMELDGADGRNLEPVAQVEVDHRGIVLPKRHAVGGVITPQ